MAQLTPLENLLRRERWLVGLTLFIAVALCWAWLIPMARDMYGPMTGASAWMMRDTWDLGHQVLLFAMWVVMMAGMMLPSAAPALLLYVGVVRRSPESASASVRAHAFAAGYLVIWTAFSVLATDDGNRKQSLCRRPADIGWSLSTHPLQRRVSQIVSNPG